MKVLFVGSQQLHSHDYGADFLLGGLYNLLGIENVFAWPEGETLHQGQRGQCDICRSGYDSNQDWPRKNHTLADAVLAADLLIIAAQPGDNTLRPPAEILSGARVYDGAGQPINLARITAEEAALKAVRDLWDDRKPIVITDMSDSVPGIDNSLHVQSYRNYYEHVIGPRLQIAQYFKRELPLRHFWATPLPLSYPQKRVPKALITKYPKVMYHAASHGLNAHSPGISRRLIVESLERHVEPTQLDVRLSTKATERLLPSEYHRRMMSALVSVSWNGAIAWDCNRFWESFAYGCCVVAERPRNEIPYAPEDGVHCVYVDRPEDVGPVVADLLTHFNDTLEMAKRGHDHFLRYHTSEARAAYVLDGVKVHLGRRDHEG